MSGSLELLRLFDAAWPQAPQLLLCQHEAEQGRAVVAHDGACPVHGGDACLVVYAQVGALRHALSNLAEDSKVEGEIEQLIDRMWQQRNEYLGVRLMLRSIIRMERRRRDQKARQAEMEPMMAFGRKLQSDGEFIRRELAWRDPATLEPLAGATPPDLDSSQAAGGEDRS